MCHPMVLWLPGLALSICYRDSIYLFSANIPLLIRTYVFKAYSFYCLSLLFGDFSYIQYDWHIRFQIFLWNFESDRTQLMVFCKSTNPSKKDKHQGQGVCHVKMWLIRRQIFAIGIKAFRCNGVSLLLSQTKAAVNTENDSRPHWKKKNKCCYFRSEIKNFLVSLIKHV